MYQFRVGKAYYINPDLAGDIERGRGKKPYGEMRLSDLVSTRKSKTPVIYEYDFGDSWQHEITLEAISERESGIKYPRCTDGARACPPEDIGGIPLFAAFLDAISNSGHVDHEDYLEWCGPYDPEAFDAREATKSMQTTQRNP